MATKEKEKRGKKSEPRYPEKKYGPFAGGCGVAVWLNEFETAEGTRFARTITIQPRRYKSKKTGAWEDAKSFRPTDLPALLLGLDAALRFIAETPLPGLPADVEDEAPA